jgi:hypothetical protein
VRLAGDPIDPVCAFHGKRRSEHENGQCLYCPLCFRSDDGYEKWVDEQGQAWDLCRECGEAEAESERRTNEAL